MLIPILHLIILCLYRLRHVVKGRKQCCIWIMLNIKNYLISVSFSPTLFSFSMLYSLMKRVEICSNPEPINVQTESVFDEVLLIFDTYIKLQTLTGYNNYTWSRTALLHDKTRNSVYVFKLEAIENSQP